MNETDLLEDYRKYKNEQSTKQPKCESPNRIYGDDDLLLMWLSGETNQLKVELVVRGETEESAARLIDEMDRDSSVREKERFDMAKKFGLEK